MVASASQRSCRHLTQPFAVIFDPEKGPDARTVTQVGMLCKSHPGQSDLVR